MTIPTDVLFEGPESVPAQLDELRGSGVTVAVIDSGWSRALADVRVLAGVGLVDPGDEFRVWETTDDHDRLGHGTACADLVLRMAPAARIVPIRIFGLRLETSTAIVVAALEWATAAGLRVINLSLGTIRPDAIRPLYVACERARRSGAIVVAAHPPRAGVTLPAAFDNVISVGGAQVFRPAGSRYRSAGAVELWAADRHACVRCGPGRVRSVGGSSFAAPIITGLVARMVEQAPNLDIDGVRAFLTPSTSRDHPNRRRFGGRG